MIGLLAIVLFAAPPERMHFQRAQELFAQEKYREALAEFSAANESSPRELPELYFNIAQCHRNLGEPRQAVAALERYLSLKPEASDKRQVRALIARLRVLPPVDKPEAEPPPREDISTTIELLPPPEPPPAPEPAPAPVENVAPAPIVMVAAPLPPPPRRRVSKAVWIGMGVGVAVLSLGLGLGLGLGLHADQPAATSGGTPMLGSAGTFDTRGR